MTREASLALVVSALTGNLALNNRLNDPGLFAIFDLNHRVDSSMIGAHELALPGKAGNHLADSMFTTKDSAAARYAPCLYIALTVAFEPLPERAGFQHLLDV